MPFNIEDGSFLHLMDLLPESRKEHLTRTFINFQNTNSERLSRLKNLAARHRNLLEE